MGGAEDLPKRASSPLKRPAADLEPDDSSLVEDVDMIAVPQSASPEAAKPSSLLSRAERAQSVNMLESEEELALGDIAPATVERNPVRPISPASEVPSVDIQIKTVTTMIEANADVQPKEGDKVFLVSKLWMNRVISRGTEARQKSKVEPEGDIGPIDNSDIIQQIIKDYEGVNFVQLKHGLGSESFQLFPEDAWNMVKEWYGLMPGTMPIERLAHNTNPDKITGIPNMQFEFHPPVLTIHRLYSNHSPILIPQILKVSNPPAPIIVMSRSSRYYDFLVKAKTATKIDLTKKTRIWRVPRVQPAAETTAPIRAGETPPASRSNSPVVDLAVATQRGPQDSWTSTLLDVVSFTQLEKGNGRELVEGSDLSLNAKYNGHSDLSQFGLGDDQTIVLDEEINYKDFVSTYSAKSASSTALTRTGAALSQPNSGRTSPAPSGPMTRGRTQKNGRVPGTVGLSNLGNTCYMNSALQCVRSVEELTKYFLTGAAKPEVNYENPLGNHGEVANAYSRLLEEIYKDPTPTSFAPRAFKNTIGRFAPSFSGYGQQDSQEFLGFLLDGLQEDLSRVKNKPYIEKPDSTDEMVGNPEAIREMAAQVWDITKKRDDSVIADLFTGLYKSTLVCPDCSKVSITFDPFNNLTLQLPIENVWSHDVFFFPLNDKPVKIVVDMSKQGTILAMKAFISSRVGVPVERLFAAEEFKHKFYKIYSDTAVASDEISTSDKCVVYELEAQPTNWPPRKVMKKKSLYHVEPEDEIPNWDDPMADKMLVPVFYRKPSRERTYKAKRAWAILPVPHFIIITPEEASNEEAIKRKIFEKVATLSNHPDLHDDDDESSDSASGSIDPDLVLTTGSDADSSGGVKVVANSIDGEDGLVNITNESNGVRDTSMTTEGISPSTLSKPSPFNTRRPKFLNPNEMLNPKFQNTFNLCYMSGAKEMIPTGWTSVDEDKTYPTLASRVPKSINIDDESSSVSGSNGINGSESSEGEGSNSDGAFLSRMVEESEEDEDPPRFSKALPVRNAIHKHGVRGPQNRSRKFNTADEPDDDAEEESPDQGPLIRLGEAIIVDWNEAAYEALFEGDEHDNFRGQNTYTDMSTLDDPELSTKRAARAKRRKNGITLDDCLDEFGKAEVLSEMDMWYCPRCKEHRRATKKFELWKTPDILVMHLKRFSSSAMRRDKLDVMVDFPMTGLDLSSRVVEKEDGKTEMYDLFAVDDHWGGLGGGHYTAFAQNFVDHEWYEYNDSSVSKVKDSSRVVSQSAYLLFYRRRSDEPLGGPRFKQIINDYDNPAADRSEDEASESGEDQGLVGISSPRGSSSPFKGAGATHPPRNRGSALKMSHMGTVDPANLEHKLPEYEAQQSNPDAPSSVAADAIMNDGLQISIEEDEGIGLDSAMETGYDVQNYPNYNPLIQPSWGWNAINSEMGGLDGLEGIEGLNRNTRSNLVSGTGSDIDCASDIVNDDSSATSSLRRDRLDDFNNAEADDFEDPIPIPDMDEMDMASGVALQHDLIEARDHYPSVEFEGDDDMDVEAPAAEIHITEDDDLKLD